MDFNKLTLKSQEAVAAAQELARRLGNPELYPEHLLLALLDQELPRQLVPDPDALRAQAEAALAQKPRIQGGQQQPQVSAVFSRVLDKAADEARRLEDDYVSTEHLLLALDVVPRDQLEAKIKAVRGGQRITSQDPEETYQALEKFGRDLTAAAEEGKLDPVIGRDEEIRRVIQVLSRRTKNNPVLIGDPGVGKTAIAADGEGAAGRLLRAAGVTEENILKALQDVRGSARVTDQNPEEKYQALERYGRDLTDLAKHGKLDPVIGRDDEIRRVVQVLSRRTKNNPVLIGEPGASTGPPAKTPDQHRDIAESDQDGGDLHRLPGPGLTFVFRS